MPYSSPRCCPPLCRLSQELELKRHSLELLEQRMAGSEASQLAAGLAASEAELADALAAAAAALLNKQELGTKAKVS